MTDMTSTATAGTRRRIIARAEPLAVNVENAARMCGLSERKIQELVEKKMLRSVFAGGRRLIFVDSIHQLLGIQKTSEAGSPQHAA